jgi:glycosyltransferase involved in cell wall biosynthesis
MDFLVHTAQPCPYDEEVRALGGRILPCLHPSRPWSYAASFRRLVAAHGPYDIIHSHVQHYSGFVLRLAHGEGIQVRIAHSHNDASPRDLAPGLLRGFYLTLANEWIRRYATVGLAASEQAAAALFGRQWKADVRWRVLYCGIDLRPFHLQPDPSVRAALHIALEALVIGHVGRFVEQKNHFFLIEVARIVADLAPRSVFLLIGDGPLRPALERRVAELRLAGRVIFAGLQADVPHVLSGAVNVFVMPSLYEGLCLAVLEAQAAGLPCVIADGITAEVGVVPRLVKRIPLASGALCWAEAILSAGRAPPPVTCGEALAALEASPFDIRRSTGELERLYTQCLSG